MKKLKKVKNIFIVGGIVIGLLIAMGVIDYFRTTRNFERPLFAMIVSGDDDGGSGLYVGIGYSIEIKGNFMPEDEIKGVTQARFYVFSHEIYYASRD